MNTEPYVVPTYRALTIVGTALTRDPSGDMVHHVVVDVSLPGAHEVVYEVLPTKRDRR